MKKWLFVVVGIAAVAGGLYFWLAAGRVQTLSEKSLAFAEVQRATIRDIVSATGLVEPRETVVVSSKGSGTVVRLSGRIGDTVYSTDELAGLDEAMIGLKVDEATNGVTMADAAILQASALLVQANFSRDAAERNYQIQVDIARTGGIRAEREQALATLDAARAGVKAAEAGIDLARAKKKDALTALKQAKLFLEMTQIRVPGSAKAKREFLILDRKVFEGQMVGPQAGPLFTLAGSLEIVEVHAQVAEGDINKVREGLAALFKIKNYDDDDTEFTGVVKRIRPLATNVAKGGVYYDTVIEVKNRKDPKTSEWQLRPGMTASIDIVRYEHKNVWRVPSEALNFTLEEAYQSESAKARVAEWRKRPDAKDWYTLWVWDEAAHQPAPLFVRIGAKNGEIALKDAEGNEIMEWEPGREPTQALRVITKAPPARAPGFFDQPANVKI